MNQSLVVEILLGVLAVMIGVGAYFGAARANRASEMTARDAIDQKAYERAQLIYESALSMSEKQVAGLRERDAVLESKLDALTKANIAFEVQVANLKASNERMDAEIDRLRGFNNDISDSERVRRIGRK